jgi:broad specificity phosphatase PhoE
VRHGESHVNVDGWNQGYIDTGLTELGKRQAESLATWMAQHVRIDALYTSTMARSLETTTYLAQSTGLAAVHDETRFGSIFRQFACPTGPCRFSMPSGHRSRLTHWQNGENWLLFRVRVGRFLDECENTTAAIPKNGGRSVTAV